MPLLNTKQSFYYSLGLVLLLIRVLKMNGCEAKSLLVNLIGENVEVGWFDRYIFMSVLSDKDRVEGGVVDHFDTVNLAHEGLLG